MSAKNLTQEKMADKINDFLGVSTYDQKRVSRWIHVGCKNKNGQVTPFPPFEIMAVIAEILEVDIDYLTGVHDQETYGIQQSCEYVGLTEGAIKALRGMTRFERKYRCELSEQHGTNTPGMIISALLASKGFPKLVDELQGLGTILDRREEKWRTLKGKYGNEIVEKALEHFDEFVCESEGADPCDAREARCINEEIIERAGVESADKEKFEKAVAEVTVAFEQDAIEGERLGMREVTGHYLVEKYFSSIVDSMYPKRFGMV